MWACAVKKKKKGFSIRIHLLNMSDVWEESQKSGLQKGWYLVIIQSVSALTTTGGEAVVERVAQRLGGLEDLGMARRQTVIRSLSHQLKTSVSHHLWISRNTAFASTCLTGLRKTSRVAFSVAYGVTSLVALWIKQSFDLSCIKICWFHKSVCTE